MITEWYSEQGLEIGVLNIPTIFSGKDFLGLCSTQGGSVHKPVHVWLETGRARTGTLRPSQPRGRRLDNYETGENQTKVVRAGPELGQGRHAGGQPADLRGGDEEDLHHRSWWVPAGGQPGAGDALLPAAGEAGPPWGQAEGPGSENRASRGSSDPSSDTEGLQPDEGNTVPPVETNRDLLPRLSRLNSATITAPWCLSS